MLRISFGDSEDSCRTEGSEVQSGKAHYFGGRSPESWITEVPLYGKVRYSDVHPGIDLVFYGRDRHLEYDFVIAPGADPSRIRLTINGADRLEVDGAGRLIAALGSEQLIQNKPLVYQLHERTDRRGEREPLTSMNVEGRWRLLESNVVGFELGAYDRSRPLVIDPAIVYSSYLNGAAGNSFGFDIAVDERGSSYIVGETPATDFPTTAGAFQLEFEGTARNAFITKLNPAGDQIVFSTFLGAGGESACGVDVDRQGAVYVTGGARVTPSFPVTPGAFDTERGGNSGFAAKLSPDGTQLLYSTFIGPQVR